MENLPRINFFKRLPVLLIESIFIYKKYIEVEKIRPTHVTVYIKTSKIKRHTVLSFIIISVVSNYLTFVFFLCLLLLFLICPHCMSSRFVRKRYVLCNPGRKFFVEDSEISTLSIYIFTLIFDFFFFLSKTIYYLG